MNVKNKFESTESVEVTGNGVELNPYKFNVNLTGAGAGNLATITVPTSDPNDGETIWLDGATLKIATTP